MGWSTPVKWLSTTALTEGLSSQGGRLFDYSRRGNFFDERGVFRGRRVKFNRLVGSSRFRRPRVDTRGLRIPPLWSLSFSVAIVYRDRE